MAINILITGGAGFVGSNVAIYLNKCLRDSHIICLDNLSRRGSEINVPRLQDNGITFIKADIRRAAHLKKITNVNCIIDCSAEPSVLAAYKDPRYTVDTNLVGTVNCLELARRENADFIFLSTSRVYPIEKLEAIPCEELLTRFDWKHDLCGEGYSFNGISHTFPVNGYRSLYGATKLCSEFIAIEYFNAFSMRGVINRFGLIAGPWQLGKADQGIVGYWTAKHKYNGSLHYIGFGGTGKQVRDAVHIDDVCDLILYQLNHLDQVNSKTYNVGGGRNNSFSLCELTQRVKEITGRSIHIDSIPENRRADIRIYITDNYYINKDTGWFPRRSLDDILIDINSWIDNYFDSLKYIFAD